MSKLWGKLRTGRTLLGFYLSVNWIKTLYFNLKMFPFATARKLPVIFYGSVKIKSLKGNFIIHAPIERGMIGFGQPYEIITRSKRTAEFYLEGEIVVKGYVQFGIDYFVHVTEGARLQLGNMASLGNNGKIICTNAITLGDFARIGFESQLMDSTFHQMIDTNTGERLPMTAPIKIGYYNYIGNRVTIMSKTVTPDYCTVSSNSHLNRDYSNLGKNTMVGGIPAKLVSENIARDWKGEEASMDKWLKIRFF